MESKYSELKWTPYPVCPYCGTEDDDVWENTHLQADGDEAEITCGKCEKKYRAVMNLDVTYATEKKGR